MENSSSCFRKLHAASGELTAKPERGPHGPQLCRLPEGTELTPTTLMPVLILPPTPPGPPHQDYLQDA